MAGIKIKDAPLIETPKDTDKIPVSDGLGGPKTINLELLKLFISEQINKEIKENAEVTAAALNDLNNKKLEDAPKDKKQYARKDGDWAEIISKNDVSDAINLMPNKFGFTGKVDVAGLKEIGWSDADIVYFKQYGVNWNDTEAENEANKVPQSDKDLMPVPSGQAGIDKIKTALATMKYCPMFDISSLLDIKQMFSDFKNLIAIPLLDTSNADVNALFFGCSNLISVPLLNVSKSSNIVNVFKGCENLKRISLLTSDKLDNIMMAFTDCINLKFISLLNFRNVAYLLVPFKNCSNLMYLEGFSGLKMGLDLSESPKLTRQSLMNVIYEAANVTASPKTLTLGATNLAKLTEADKKVATDKGWTLA